MRDDEFTYRVLPFSYLDFGLDHRPALDSAQQLALDDVINQLISKLVTAAQDRSDPLRPMRILAACHSIASEYRREGFDIFAEFEHALRTDLHNALRMARRIFLRALFLCPPHQFPAFKRVLEESGWHMSNPEVRADYQMVERELFHADGRMRDFAVKERQRRNMA